MSASTYESQRKDRRMTAADGVVEYRMFIDSEWVDAADSATTAIVDPATEEVFARVASAGRDEAETAVAAARQAFDKGPWPSMTAPERAQVLQAAAAGVRERADELARLETRQMGKLLADAAVDIGRVAYGLDYAASLAIESVGHQVPITYPKAFASVQREPVGVVVGITPWNFPLMLASWKFAPALAAGNAVIIKPASISPLTTLEMAAIFDDAGLPRGVFQVVVGPGGTVGDYFAASPDVDMISLTGSVEVGRQIMARAAGSIKRIGLELGGKSPNIVFADADFEAAIQGVLFGVFCNAGQVCAAGTRLLLERPIYDEFIEELVKRAHTIKVGPGHDPLSQMGPLASAQQLATTEEYVRIGTEEGARLACGGKRVERKGYFFEPTIFTDVTNDMRVAREEIFGPVLSVIPFEGEAEAVEIANDSIYGLAAGVWSLNGAKALRVANALRAGMLYVNTYNWAPIELPWGGYKQSGIGRELGHCGLEEFTEVKSMILDMTGEPVGFYPDSQ